MTHEKPEENVAEPARLPALQPLLHDVIEFHKKFQLEYDGPLRTLEEELQSFRSKFLDEELCEYTTAAMAALKSSQASELDPADITYHLDKALDALCDYVYVALGNAYLHGLREAPPISDFIRHRLNGRPHYVGVPRVLGSDWLEEFSEQMAGSTVLYEHKLEHDDVDSALEELIDSAHLALLQAETHGFPFLKAWERVHAANMTKVRAQRPQDSERGGTWDVIKPPNFVPPCHKDLVEDHLHAR